jgi:2-polyprenyl-3-methyl-5-hydroxy-6-metoxy-1,4-benzoquinol methylase
VVDPDERLTNGGKIRCWICRSSDAGRWKSRGIDRPLTADDLRITDSRYGVTLALWRCRRCGFIFAGDADPRELAALYEQLSDPDYLESQEPRARQTEWLLEHVLRTKPDARTLLDIGAGTGLLVAEAQRRNLIAVGVEPSRALTESGRRSHGVDLLQGLFPHPQLAGRTFDVVCLVDVIEHLADPMQMLHGCAAVLSPDGVLVVVTPDIGSLTAALLRKRWWHYRLAHVGYFNRKSLRRAAALAGLTPVAAFRPRWFLTVEYIATRLERYVPIGGLNRLARRHDVLRRVYRQVVPLNPRDSMLVMFRQSTRETP